MTMSIQLVSCNLYWEEMEMIYKIENVYFLFEAVD